MRGMPHGGVAWALLLTAALTACDSSTRGDGPGSEQDELHAGQAPQPGGGGQAGDDGAGMGVAGAPASSSGAGASAPAPSVTTPEPTTPVVEPPVVDGGQAPTPPPHAPRVLVFDGAARRFAIHDAAGAIVHDLWPRLGIDGPRPSVSVSWDETTMRADNTFMATRLRTRFAGIPDTLPTRLIVATDAPSGGMHVERWALDGELLAEVELGERWEHFALSPTGAYLFVERAHSADSFVLDAAVIRFADGSVVWQGLHEMAAFAPDDGHFVFTPGRTETVGLVDLETEEETGFSNPDVFKYEQEVLLSLEACSSAGAVLRTYGFINDGQPLWWFGWDGTLRAFDPELPRFAEEIFWTFTDGGASVEWQRIAKQPQNGETPIDPALLGYFEHDPATGENRIATPPDYECPEGRVRRFEVRDAGLAVCDCASDTCEVVAPLPALDQGWERSARGSPDDRYALLTYGWPHNSFPMSWPDSVLYDADGAQLAELAAGYGSFDRYSRLLLYNASTGMPPQTLIVELSTARVTSIERPHWSAIVYE